MTDQRTGTGDGTDTDTSTASRWTLRGPRALSGRTRRAWGWVLTFGVATVLAGIAVLVWPGLTLVLVALIIGAQLVVAGVFQFVRAFTTRGTEGGSHVLLGVLAVLSFLAGIILLRHPFGTMAVMALIVGLFWVVGGVIEVYHGIAERGLSGRGMVIAVGALSVLAGVAVLVFPGVSLAVFAWLFGIWLLVYGVMEVGTAFVMRRAGSPDPALPPVTGPAPAV